MGAREGRLHRAFRREDWWAGGAAGAGGPRGAVSHSPPLRQSLGFLAAKLPAPHLTDLQRPW